MDTTPKQSNPRFVWVIGDIREEFPDVPNAPYGGDMILWDRQEQKVAMTCHRDYANAICLERTDRPDAQPFTAIKKWLNENDSLESEGIVPTEARFVV